MRERERERDRGKEGVEGGLSKRDDNKCHVN